jgi:hypothetical protein
MISPAEFRSTWDESLSWFTPFPESVFEGTQIPAVTKQFLTEIGLPGSVAPFLDFGPDHEVLETPSERWGLSEPFAQYWIIGCNGYGDPIVLTSTGSVLYLNHDAGMREVYINKDVATLAEALLRYEKLISEAQEVGGPDAFLDNEIPVDLQNEFEAFLKQIDPQACAPDTMWGGEVIAEWHT